MKKTTKIMTKFGKILLVIGFAFSQLSFPLSVLAEELATDTNRAMSEEEKQLTLQEEQTDDTDGEIIEEQSTTNNEESEENVPNEEEQLPSEETNFTVELVENEEQNFYIIKNELDTTLTVKQLKEANTPVTTIVNLEGIELTDETEEIKSGYQVTITREDSSEKTYVVIILGDYDNDGMVTVKDKEALLEILKTASDEEISNNMLLLDLNKDEKFDVLDVTHPVFTSGIWEFVHIATDELENYLMASAEEVYLDEEIEVNYFIDGFELDNLVGVQGKINYDKTLLELTKIQVSGIEKDLADLKENQFVYLLEKHNQNGVLITLTFKALATGTPTVSIEEIVTSSGGVLAKIDVDKVSTSFNNIEYGKGGNEKPEAITPTTSETTSVTPTPVVVQSTPKYVSLSTDNYIKSLIIEGYEIEFDKNVYEYSIKVKNDVSALKISVLLNSDKAIYYVEGNENFEVGENYVNIIVKAENGSTKTYTIKVEKEKKEETVKDKTDKDEEKEEEATVTSKTVIIILIVLVIIGLIYVIFKDDEEDTKESEKETKKGSKK